MVRHLLSGPGGPGDVLPGTRLPSGVPSSGQTWCLRSSEAQSTLHRCLPCLPAGARKHGISSPGARGARPGRMP